MYYGNIISVIVIFPGDGGTNSGEVGGGAGVASCSKVKYDKFETRASQSAYNTPVLAPWSKQEIHARAIN